MPSLLAYALLFTGISAFFIFSHLMLGKLVRPARPDAEKKTIYECGEPTIGSSWIQFDLRFYVVALLFVIFDVEVAFFFPWAVVFGKANTLARTETPETKREPRTITNKSRNWCRPIPRTPPPAGNTAKPTRLAPLPTPNGRRGKLPGLLFGTS